MRNFLSSQTWCSFFSSGLILTPFCKKGNFHHDENAKILLRRAKLVSSKLAFLCSKQPARWPNCHKVLVKTDQTHRKCFFYYNFQFEADKRQYVKTGRHSWSWVSLGLFGAAVHFQVDKSSLWA